MALVTRWGSEVRTVSPLEPGPEDPKPKALDSTPLPVIPTGDAYNRLPFFQNPTPLKRNFQHPLPPELPDPPAAGLDINGAQIIPAPANGLDITDISIGAPAAGLDVNTAIVIPPANGLDIENVSVALNPPANGLDVNNASVQPPVAGLDANNASVIAPANGLDIGSVELRTLNIEIVSDQSFSDDPSSGELGEIKYSSDSQYLYIHDGTNWQRTNGGNS